MDEKKLKSVPLFASLPKQDRRRIAQVADEIDADAGEELVREGRFAYEFIVIQEGQAEVTRDGQRVAQLGPGDFLGEIAALERGTRTATVVTTSPASLIVMTARDLRRLADSIPALGDSIHATAQERRP
ncbi:MAG TPA: cyclic nucleotide-binding domain-containing protein [Solirubrobacteraceae bacterium]|nr:cyclic nucleotide-binding domain-containing protein [Solirubrobacteraceae bacterium]